MNDHPDHMYILGKRILGTKISTPGFFTNYKNLAQYQAQLFCYAFFIKVPQTAQKWSEVQKRRKMSKLFPPLFADPI